MLIISDTKSLKKEEEMQARRAARELALILFSQLDKNPKQYSELDFKNIVLTEASKNAVPVKELKKYFPGATVYANHKEINLKNLQGNILICGSFYLAGLPIINKKC